MFQLEYTHTCGGTRSVYNRVDWDKHFTITQALSAEEVGGLQEIYDYLPHHRVKRFYNIFNTMRADVIQDDMSPEILEKWRGIRSSLEKAADAETYNHYFLKYGPGSFTKLHRDNVDEVARTGVTFVDKTADLVGGENLINVPYHKDQEFNEFDVNWYTQEDEGQWLIFDTPKTDVGDTLWYEQVNHGVSYVHQGFRTVLISWFRS